jgi:hypothetical protein
MKGFHSKVNGNVAFWERVEKTDGCWFYTGGHSGTVRVNGTSTRVRYYAYSQAIGAIPDGARVQLTCTTRLCVNPSHLRLSPTQQRYTCEECGTLFSPKASSRIKYCSRECSFAHIRVHGFPEMRGPRIWSKPIDDRKMPLPHRAIYPRECVICSTVFIARFKYRVACSILCRVQRGNKKLGGKAKPLIQHVCQRCGISFTPAYRDKRRTYCSNTCVNLIGGTNLERNELTEEYIGLATALHRFRQYIHERSRRESGPGTDYYRVATDVECVCS